MSDDLDDLFAAPTPGPALDVRFRQGTVLSFNASTYANQVSVGGTTFNNLPCIGISANEATALAATPGLAVALAVLANDRGTNVLAIWGRLVSP